MQVLNLKIEFNPVASAVWQARWTSMSDAFCWHTRIVNRPSVLGHAVNVVQDMIAPLSTRLGTTLSTSAVASFRRHAESVLSRVESLIPASDKNNTQADIRHAGFEGVNLGTGLLQEDYYRHLFGMSMLTDGPMSDQEEAVLSELQLRLLSSKTDLPSLPVLASRLLQTDVSNSEEWHKLMNMLEKSPNFQKELLAMAQGPLFDVGDEVDSLEQLIEAIDREEMQELMLFVALLPLMGWKSLRLQAIKTATACRAVAKHTSTRPFDAWLAGLVSHIGMVEALRQMQGFDENSHGPRSLAFVQEMVKRTRQLSYRIVQAWQLPATVQQAVKEQAMTGTTRPTVSIVGKALSLGTSVAMMHTLVRAGAAHSPSARLKVVAENRFQAAKHAYTALYRWAK